MSAIVDHCNYVQELRDISDQIMSVSSMVDKYYKDFNATKHCKPPSQSDWMERHNETNSPVYDLLYKEFTT